MTTYIILDDSNKVELLDKEYMPEVGDELVLNDRGIKRLIAISRIERILNREGNSVDIKVNIYVNYLENHVD